MAQGKIPEDFEVGTPVLVCRWRLQGQALPASGRHLRAFGQRSIGGERLSRELVAWARQHIEWTLGEGTSQHPDGVLMVMIDELGRAAMTAGDYEPLADCTLAALAERARAARLEALECDIAPETLWAVRDGALVCGIAIGEYPSGATSLVIDLAQTIGMSVERDPALADSLALDAPRISEAFLVSDEHGVVVAQDAAGPKGMRFSDGWDKLLASADRRGGGRRRRG